MTRTIKLSRMWLMAVAASFASALPCTSQSSGAIDPRTKAALIEAREAVWRAYYQGDSSALVRLLPEKMVAMNEDRAEIIRNAKSYVKDGGKYLGITFTRDQFFVNGNTAIIWSHFDVRLTNAKGRPTPTSGTAIELFVLEGGRWINPHWHLDGDKKG